MNTILATGFLIVAFVLNLFETNDMTLTLISYLFFGIAGYLAKDWIRQRMNELL